jgi:hypothetical protein
MGSFPQPFTLRTIECDPFTTAPVAPDTVHGFEFVRVVIHPTVEQNFKQLSCSSDMARVKLPLRVL